MCEALLLGHLVHGCKLAGKLCLLADDLEFGLQVQSCEKDSSCQLLRFGAGTSGRASLTSELLLTWNSTCKQLSFRHERLRLEGMCWWRPEQYLSVALVESGHLPLVKAGETPPELLRLQHTPVAAVDSPGPPKGRMIAEVVHPTSSVVVASAFFSAL